MTQINLFPYHKPSTPIDDNGSSSYHLCSDAQQFLRTFSEISAEKLWKDIHRGDINFSDKKCHHGLSILHLLIHQGYDEIVIEYLKRYGIKHPWENQDGKYATVLDLAIAAGSWKIYQFIIQKLKDLRQIGTAPSFAFQHAQFDDKYSSLGSPIHIAIIARQTKMLQNMLEFPWVKQLFESKLAYPLTPLQLACLLGNVSAVRDLRIKEAELEYGEGEKGGTALFCAVIGRKYKALNLLYLLKANLRALDHQGLSALYLVKFDASPKGIRCYNVLSNLLTKQNLDRYQKHNFKIFPPSFLILAGGYRDQQMALGALEHLEKENLLLRVQRVAAAGFSSIIAALFAVGVSFNEIQTIFQEKIPQLIDRLQKKDIEQKPGLLRRPWKSLGKGIKSVFSAIPSQPKKKDAEHPYVLVGERLRLFLENKITEQTGTPQLTFRELNQLVHIDPAKFKDLHIFLSQKKEEETSSLFMNSEDPNWEDVIISEAVYASVLDSRLFQPHHIRTKKNNSILGSLSDLFFLNPRVHLLASIFDNNMLYGQERYGQFSNPDVLIILSQYKDPLKLNENYYTKDLHDLLSSYYHLDEQDVQNLISSNRFRMLNLTYQHEEYKPYSLFEAGQEQSKNWVDQTGDSGLNFDLNTQKKKSKTHPENPEFKYRIFFEKDLAQNYFIQYDQYICDSIKFTHLQSNRNEPTPLLQHKELNEKLSQRFADFYQERLKLQEAEEFSINRDSLIQKIRQVEGDKLRVVAITGPRWSGKTHLAIQYSAMQIKEDSNCKTYFIPFEHLIQKNSASKELNIKDIKRFQEEVDLEAASRWVMIIDGVDLKGVQECNKVWKSLQEVLIKSFSNAKGTLIFTCRHIYFLQQKNFNHMIKIRGFLQEELNQRLARGEDLPRNSAHVINQRSVSLNLEPPPALNLEPPPAFDRDSQLELASQKSASSSAQNLSNYFLEQKDFSLDSAIYQSLDNNGLTFPILFKSFFDRCESVNLSITNCIAQGNWREKSLIDGLENSSYVKDIDRIINENMEDSICRIMLFHIAFLGQASFTFAFIEAVCPKEGKDICELQNAIITLHNNDVIQYSKDQNESQGGYYKIHPLAQILIRQMLMNQSSQKNIKELIDKNSEILKSLENLNPIPSQHDRDLLQLHHEFIEDFNNRYLLRK